MEWQSIHTLDGFDGLCFRFGEFVAASRWEEKDFGPTQFVWELFHVAEDGSLKPLRIHQHIISEGRDQSVGGHLDRAKLMIHHALEEWSRKQNSPD